MILVAVIVVVLLVRFPRLELQESERSGGLHSYRELLKTSMSTSSSSGCSAIRLGTGRCQLISEFLRQYHGLDPQTVGAPTVGRFWGYMSVGASSGCSPSLWDARDVLKVAGVLAIACCWRRCSAVQRSL